MVAAVVALAALAPLGCGSADDATSSGPTPLCAAVWELGAIWDTRAPEAVLGDNDALADFAAALLNGFDAAAGVVAAEAPPDVVADLEVATEGLITLYDNALAYAAGDMASIPVQQPDEVQAFARVRAWGEGECGPSPD